MTDSDDGESQPQYQRYEPDSEGQAPDSRRWQGPDEEDSGFPSTFNVYRSDPPQPVTPPRWADAPYEEEDNETAYPPFPDSSEEILPSSGKRFTNHIVFYVVVLSLLPVTLWLAYASVTPDLQKVYLWPAIVTTVFGLITVVLRHVRGSVIEAERTMREFLMNDQRNGITPSYRLGRKVHWGEDEKVGWESKLHPISIVIGGFGRMQSKWRRFLALAVVVVVVVQATRTHDPEWYLLMAVALAIYIAYLYVEWSRDTYAITNKRIMGVTGLFESKLATMPTSKVTDFTSTAPWQSNLLAWLRWIDLPYTHWNVESAGQDQALKYIYYVRAGDVVASVFGLG